MESLIKAIQELEFQSTVLNPDQKIRERWFSEVGLHSERFLNSFETQKAYQSEDPSLSLSIQDTSFDAPKALEDILLKLKIHVEDMGINTTSSRYFGFIPTGGLYLSALGDYIAAVSNRYSGNFYCAPGAVRIENKLLQWMSELIGFPKTASGNLTSGGSMANLIAIIAAREMFELKGSDYSKTVIYLTQHTHLSVEKSLKTIGMQEAVKRVISVDQNFCLNADVLKQTIDEDRILGLKPWLIIASAGTTDTGAVDPLEAIAKLCEKEKLWLHVDAAYGGFFALTETGKTILKGIEGADSITLDPHKSLFLPYGLGAVLVRDYTNLKNVFAQTATYMEICDQVLDELSPCDLSPELSRHFRALRLWIPLNLFGLAPFRAALTEKLMLAQFFYQKIKNIAKIEVLNFPHLTIVPFRFIPNRGDVNDFNEKLIQQINNDGRIYLSSTRLNGNFYLRMAILSFRSHLKDVELALEVIKEMAISALEKED